MRLNDVVVLDGETIPNDCFPSATPFGAFDGEWFPQEPQRLDDPASLLDIPGHFVTNLVPRDGRWYSVEAP